KLNYSPPELLDDLGLANHKRGKLLIARTPRTRVHISQVRVGPQMPSPGPEQSRYTRVWRPTPRDTSPPRDGGRATSMSGGTARKPALYLPPPETTPRFSFQLASRSRWASGSDSSFLSVWFSIWRMRSRVTLNARP